LGEGVSKFCFNNGASYTRNEAFRAMGMDPIPSWGNTSNGYFEYQDTFFVFCNVGVPGRTGHDYANRFEGTDLLWTGRTGSSRRQPLIQRMLTPDAEVHLFYREDNSAPFTYIGLGIAKSADDEIPVEIRWGFKEIDHGAEQIEFASPMLSHIEGAPRPIVSTRYERSAAARAQCIRHYGPKCQICAFDFLDRYGDLGAGFIHVHHHISISSIQENYVVDPIKDLIPVCPNCHAILHRGNTVRTMEEVRMALQAAREIERT
jgi:5-methylcytosine-specific restriction protein A